MIVTAIIAFGADFELYYAVPLGIFAGALAAFFISLADANTPPDRTPSRSTCSVATPFAGPRPRKEQSIKRAYCRFGLSKEAL
jgi:hypothetical protein